jgi:TolB-like protein/Tfp pilus assembly protein PilF
MPGSQYAFEPFVFDPGSATLMRDGQPVSLGQRGAALLGALLEAGGGIVSKAELMEAAWPSTIVEEGNLTVQVANLRKALGSRPDGTEWIATVPRVGYRLLRGEGAAAIEPTRLPTLAVLPFHNLSGDAEQDYFADGMVDDLITALSRFKSFAVIARSSSFAYKGRPTDVRQVAADLGVRYVLEGSVRRAGNRLRISAQLIDGADGANLWAHNFDGVIDDVFEFQDRITASVASVVEPHIQNAEIERARRERPGSIAAYDLYLRAVSKLYLFQPEANAEAIRLLEKALEIEPENGVFLGFACWALEHRSTMAWSEFGPDDRERCLALAHEAVQRASNDATVLAHCGLAMQLIGHDYERGLVIADRAVELNPNDLVALINGGISHLVGGDLEQAKRLLHRAIEIHPNDAYEPMSGIANVHCCLGEYEQGLAWATRSAALRGNYVPTHWILVAANVHLGRLDAARKALAVLMKLSPGTSIRRFVTGPLPKEPQRAEMLIEGFRLAGMPEE